MTRLLESYRGIKNRIMSQIIWKVVAWRIISVVIGTFITILYTGNVNKSITLVLLLTVILTIVHYIFERVWESHIKGKGIHHGKE